MKQVLFVVLICLSLSSYAQIRRVKNLPNYDKKQLHFGFTVGFNTMDFTLKNSDLFWGLDEVYGIENERSVGFHLGPVSNLRLGNYFDFRALIDLSFGQRTLLYKVAQDTIGGYPPFFTHKMEIESIFVEFPLQIKYKSVRINNYRPYIIAGINPKIDLAARREIKEEEMPKLRIQNTDLYYEIGFGVDYYLQYFKFSTEIKFAFGLRDLLIPIADPQYHEYSDALKSINSKMIVISFHFE